MFLLAAGFLNVAILFKLVFINIFSGKMGMEEMTRRNQTMMEDAMQSAISMLPAVLGQCEQNSKRRCKLHRVGRIG